MPTGRLDSLDNNELLAAYANGEQNAAKILTDRLMKTVYNQAYHMLRNSADAEDITQESFMRLWRIAPNWIKDKAKISTWLYRVNYNLCIDKLRQRKHTNIDEVPEPIDHTQNTGELLQNKDRVSALYSALEKLPERQKKAVTMRHLNELSNSDIAKVMETSIESVESLISRGKGKLKDILYKDKDKLGYKND